MWADCNYFHELDRQEGSRCIFRVPFPQTSDLASIELLTTRLSYKKNINICKLRGEREREEEEEEEEEENGPGTISSSSPLIDGNNRRILQTFECRAYENRCSWGLRMPQVRRSEMQPNFQ